MVVKSALSRKMCYFAQDIPENAADVAHLNGLHSPSLLAGSDLRYTRRLLYSFAQHIWSANWQPNPDAHHKATMHLHHEFRLFSKIPIIAIDGHIKQVCIVTYPVK
jgi:cholesterol 7-dehydrogenase